MTKRVLAASAFSILAAACTVMSGLHLPQGAVGPGGDDDDDDARASTNPDARQADGAPICSLKHAPAKPKAGAGGTDTTIVVAMKEMVPRNDGPPFGIDLDNLCTCPDIEACTSAKGVPPHCDNYGDGLDNAGADLFKGLISASVNIIDQSNLRVKGGRYGLVVKIEGYNGLPDDDAITVTLLRSPGVDGGPVFTTVNTWPVGGTPVVSTEAYVSATQLVARFDAVEVPFLDDSPVPAKMRGATLLGAIVEGSTFGSAVIAGRANENEMIASIRELEYQDTGFGLCQSALYNGFASGVCDKADLPTNQADDGKGAKCDAFSFAVSMSFVPAQIGNTTSIPAVPERCDGIAPITCP